MAGSSTIEELPPKHQVFISFRGEVVVHKFVGHLYRALRSNNIKVFIDNAEARGQQLQLQFRRIEESTIALVIFSGKYTESTSCLSELARIKDCVDERKMRAVTIFYKLDPSTVKNLEGQFGDAFRDLKESDATKKIWEKALKSIASTDGFIVDQYSDEAEKLKLIVNWVKFALIMIKLNIVPSEGNQEASVDPSEHIETGISAGGNKTVEGVKESLNKIPSDGDQEVFMDPSENIETGVSVGRNKTVEEVSNKIPSYGNQEASVDPLENIETRISPEKTVTRLEKVCFSAMTKSSTVEQLPPQHQVFINVHGKLSYKFVNRVVEALVREKINVFIDMDESRAQKLEVPLKTIEDSRIALVVFSKEYTEPGCRLEELVKIANCVEKGKLVAIPVYYKLDQSTMRVLTGQYGIGDVSMHQWERERDTAKERWKKASKSITETKGIIVEQQRDLRESDASKEMWKKALKSITDNPGIIVDNMSGVKEILKILVDGVKCVLNKISSEESQEASLDSSENIETEISPGWNTVLNNLLFNRVLKEVPSEGNQEASVEFPTGKFGTKPERSFSDPTTNTNLIERTCSTSPMDGKVKPPIIQVFISFRGEQLRSNFVGHLVAALRKSEINFFIDTKANIGEDLHNLFKRIEDSGIAIVVFSSRYTESEWCLNELVKIKELAHQGLLKVLPIFYKVTPYNVKRLKGDFGDNFREQEYKYQSDEPKIKRWKEAIVSISNKHALTFDEKSGVFEIDFIETIVKAVISAVETGQSSRYCHAEKRFPKNYSSF